MGTDTMTRHVSYPHQPGSIHFDGAAAYEAQMTLEDACRTVLGKRAADAIIADQGLHWCFVAAVAAAKTSHPREALDVIKERLQEIRQERDNHA